MSQHDMNLENQPGAAFRADLNGALVALASDSSGAAAPSTTYPYQTWIDTSGSTGIVRKRNNDNTAWIFVGLLSSDGWAPYEKDKFSKADGSRPAWATPTAVTLETASGLTVAVGATLVTIAEGTAVTLPTLTPGTDYTIYAATDGTLEAVDADSAGPSGIRAVGGFHARAGDGNINPRSCWDLNWKPSANPRGMTLSLDGQTWADIYLCDVNYALNGYSRSGQTIADSGNPPKVPTVYGGDGVAAYARGSWWSFNDVLSSAKKRFPSYQEFTAIAAGVVERQSVGIDPVTTQHQGGHRSVCGAEQITGVAWQWGEDITGTNATGSAVWNEWGEGRGDIFANSFTAPLFGGEWASGVNAGSRASGWFQRADETSVQIGARGVCSHVNMQGVS